jgi:hypothetical protein
MSELSLIKNLLPQGLIDFGLATVMFDPFINKDPTLKVACEFLINALKVNNVCSDGRCPCHAQAVEGDGWPAFWRNFLAGTHKRSEFLTTTAVSLAVMRAILYDIDFRAVLLHDPTLKLTPECDSEPFSAEVFVADERSNVNAREPLMFPGYGIREPFFSGAVAHDLNYTVCLPLSVYTMVHVLKAGIKFDNPADDIKAPYGIIPCLVRLLRTNPEEVMRALTECITMDFEQQNKKRKKELISTLQTLGVVPFDSTFCFMVDIASLLLVNISSAINHGLLDLLRLKLNDVIQGTALNIDAVENEDNDQKAQRLYAAVDIFGVNQYPVLLDLFPKSDEPVFAKMCFSPLKNAHGEVVVPVKQYIVTVLGEFGKSWQFVIAVLTDDPYDPYPGLRAVPGDHCFEFDTDRVNCFMMPPKTGVLANFKQRHSSYVRDDSNQFKLSSKKEFHFEFRNAFHIKTSKDFHKFRSKGFFLATFVDLVSKAFDRTTAAQFIATMEMYIGYEHQCLAPDLETASNAISKLIDNHFVHMKSATMLSGSMLTGYKKFITGCYKFDLEKEADEQDLQGEDRTEFFEKTSQDQITYLAHLLGSVVGDNVYAAYLDDNKSMFAHNLNLEDNLKSYRRANLDRDGRLEGYAALFIDRVTTKITMHELALRMNNLCPPRLQNTVVQSALAAPIAHMPDMPDDIPGYGEISDLLSHENINNILSGKDTGEILPNEVYEQLIDEADLELADVDTAALEAPQEAPKEAPAPKLPEVPKKAPAPKLPEVPKKAPAPKLPEVPKEAPAPKLPEVPKEAPAPKLPEVPKKAPAPKTSEQNSPSAFDFPKEEVAAATAGNNTVVAHETDDDNDEDDVDFEEDDEFETPVPSPEQPQNGGDDSSDDESLDDP